MAAQTFQGLSIVSGPAEIACRAKTWNGPDVTVEPLDTTALCSPGWKTSIGGLKSSAFSADVMQDYDTLANGGIDLTSWSELATVDPTSVLPAGVGDGALAYLWQSLRLEWVPFANGVGELAMGRLGGSSVGPVARGMVLSPAATARTATGNGTPQQLGAVTAGQALCAALHVVAASGTSPSVTVDIQSSATSGGTFTTRGSFTAATGVSAQWLSLPTAQAHTWWRARWTISGTTPSFGLLVTAGITNL